MPANQFQGAGNLYSTPGTELRVSANAGVAPIDFSTIDPTLADRIGLFFGKEVRGALIEVGGEQGPGRAGDQRDPSGAAEDSERLPALHRPPVPELFA